MVADEEVGGEVWAELRKKSFTRKEIRQSFCGGERNFVVAGDFWRVEEEEPVHQVSGENGSVKSGSGFEEDVEDFAAAEFLEGRIEIELTLPARDAKKVDTGVL